MADQKSRFSLFGFRIGKKEDELKQDLIQPSFAPPSNEDGALTITSAAQFGTSALDLDGSAKNEIELITRYREMAMQPEVESAIEDIVNEAIVRNDEGKNVEIVLDDLKQSDKIKKAIREEFDTILKLLNYDNMGTDIFRRYYVDGRLNYHVIVDIESPQKGIQELRYIDPRKIRKIREVKKQKDAVSGVEVITKVDEYYVFAERITTGPTNSPIGGVKIAPDSILNVNSGLMDARRGMVLSYLHKGLKPLNQLRMIEDAVVIYRLCLVGDTRVKTTNGWKYIKDITDGDEVYSFYGREQGLLSTKVKKQWKTGTKQTYIVSSKHFSITGTDNHPILVLNKNTNIVEYVDIKDLIPKVHAFVYEKPKNDNTLTTFLEIRNKSIKILNSSLWSDYAIENKEKYITEISETLNIKRSSVRNFLYGIQYLNKDDATKILDEIELEGFLFDEKYEFLSKNADVNLPEYIDEEFARLFGFMIGDGSVGKNGMCFAEGADKEQNAFYANLLNKYFGNCVRQNTKRRYSNYNTCSTLGAELFKKLGFISGAKNKRIPEWVFNSSDEIKKQFVIGLADADGCSRNSIYTDLWSSEIELCNKQLVEDIKELWTSIGLSSGKIRYRQSKESFRTIGEELEPRLMKATESWTIYISDLPLPKFEPILSITESNIEDVYELEVESEKHNFVANGIIVHNSRAPERRVFYVDVGNLPRIKAEQYVRDIMTKYKNKLVYDACLDLNTMIPLMDGRSLLLKEIIIEYKEGKELWAYSCNPETGEFAPGLITWAGVTKLDQQVVRVVLENRKEIVCTLDHKFPVWDKGFVEAKDLDYDDVLMTFDGQNDSDKEKGMKVVEMEILKETMNVGTLTIDGEEIHHDYHTFALDVGVYTKNSTGEVRDDRRHLCLKMDTKVPLLDGRMLTLEEISKEYKEKELWAYSCNPETGEFAPGLITWAGVSNPNAKIMRVTLDNGKTIDCTPEHRFPVWEQGMVEAKDLKVGDSMIPLYTRKEKVSKKRETLYEQFYDNHNKKWVYTHREVSKWKDAVGIKNELTYSEEYTESKKGAIHHININSFDNSPPNLVRMNYRDHIKMHGYMGTTSGIKNRDNGVGIFNKEHPDYLTWKLQSGEKGRKVLAELIQDPEWNAEFRQKQREGWTEEKKEVASEHAKRNKLSERGNAAQKEQWKTTERKKKHNDMYAVEYTIEMFDAIKKIINGSSSKEKLAEILNTYNDLLDSWTKVNENKCLSSTQKSFDKFTKYDVDKIVRQFSGTTFAEFRTQVKYRNHKIAKIEYLDERADTGCLTIDGDEKYHNYHTFALEAGIYTQNSMTEDFWMPRRSDNKSTEITTLPGGCFDMDTKVSLLDGRELSIREIELELSEGNELWTYSCEPITGKVVPGLISWAGVTQKSAKVMELILDNGEKIVCTPEHKFPVYGKKYKEAREFVIGDSLIPLYRRKSPLKSNYTVTYEEFFDNHDKKWKFTHRVVSSELKDTLVNYKIYDESSSNGNYDVVHHIDLNRYNNSPLNLCYMAWKDHSKLHQDNINELKERPDYLENLRIGVNKYYENRTEEERVKHSERSSAIWENFTEEEYYSVCEKISKGLVNYCENLSEEEREIRAERSRLNFKKGTEAFIKKLLEDEDFKQQISEKRKSYWTDEKREECGERLSIRSKIWWESEEHRANHKKKQKVEFSHSMLLKMIDLVKGKTTHQVTLLDILNELNNDPILLEELKELNKHKSVPNWNVNDGFTAPLLVKLVISFGYDSWKDFRVKESLHNHRIVGIRYLDDPIEVGTLTIDYNELHHDYHTFALSCGVFVFNSNLGQLDDVTYFEKKLYKSLNVPVSRLDPQQAVSIGRSTEITRDELKFSRFIDKLRTKFSELFDNALRVQLILKGICTEEEWKEFKESICYDFIKDNKFVELKEAELMQERLGILAIIDQYSGKYYSKHWIQKNVLRLKDAEIEQMEQQIDQEKEIDFSDQAEDQQKQIQLQAQAMQLQNELMPQQEPQIDANAPDEQQQGGGSPADAARALHNTEKEQLAKRKTNNPYEIQQR